MSRAEVPSRVVAGFIAVGVIVMVAILVGRAIGPKPGNSRPRDNRPPTTHLPTAVSTR